MVQTSLQVRLTWRALRSMQLRRAKLLTHFQAADRNIWRAFSIRSCSIFKQGRAPAPISAIIRGSGFFYRRPYHFLRCDKILKRAPAPISAIIRGSGFFVLKKERSFLLRSLLFFITFLFLRVPATPVHTVRSPPQTSEARPQRVLHDYP